MPNGRFAGRPRKRRRIGYDYQNHFFKPQGIPLHQLEIIELSLDELEALRLKNLRNLDQTQAAAKMQISQSTFQRLLNSAYQKISQALVHGQAIIIKKIY